MVSRNTTPFFDFILFERYTSKQFNQEQGLALFPLTTVPIYIVSVPKIKKRDRPKPISLTFIKTREGVQ